MNTRVFWRQNAVLENGGRAVQQSQVEILIKSFIIKLYKAERGTNEQIHPD